MIRCDYLGSLFFSVSKALTLVWYGVNMCHGARDRARTGTPLQARDFKSLVSTYSTTRAQRTNEANVNTGS